MTGESVAVHVNRDGHGTVEAPAGALEFVDDFAVSVTNHGAPVHVHCRLDGDVAAVATVAESNVFVEADAETIVPIAVRSTDALEAPLSGSLEIATQYGAASTSVAITIRPGPETVDVDESLSKPGGGDAARSRTDPSPSLFGAVDVDLGTLAVLVLSLVAVGVGIVTAATVGGTTAIVAVLVAVVGLGAAVATLPGVPGRDLE